MSLENDLIEILLKYVRLGEKEQIWFTLARTKEERDANNRELTRLIKEYNEKRKRIYKVLH